MKDALMEMVKDRADERVGQAMDALGIPQAQGDMYAGLVQKKS